MSSHGVSQHQLKLQKPQAFLCSPRRAQLCRWVGKSLPCFLAKWCDVQVWYCRTSQERKVQRDLLRSELGIPPFSKKTKFLFLPCRGTQDARLYAFPSSLAGYFSPWMGQRFNLIDDIPNLGERKAWNFGGFWFFFSEVAFLFQKWRLQTSSLQTYPLGAVKTL